MSLYTTLWGGPNDGRIVRIFEETEEVRVPRPTPLGDTRLLETLEPEIARYVRDEDGIFRFAGVL